MGEGRKRAVSMRLSAADLRKIKCIAQRLGVRESDVIRFAVKTTLTRLSLLSDPAIRGRSLLPLFIDPTKELAAHFDLDATKLNDLINSGIEDDTRRVPLDDLHGIAMNGVPGQAVPFARPLGAVVQPVQGFETVTHTSKPNERRSTMTLSRHRTADTEPST
ncbi:MAG: hypothetical protein U0412_00045 [Nitrospira sp.]